MPSTGREVADVDSRRPRGGIATDVFWQTGKLPKGMWISDQGAAPYRGWG
jgi:hypothetical protein